LGGRTLRRTGKVLTCPAMEKETETKSSPRGLELGTRLYSLRGRGAPGPTVGYKFGGSADQPGTSRRQGPSRVFSCLAGNVARKIPVGAPPHTVNGGKILAITLIQLRKRPYPKPRRGGRRRREDRKLWRMGGGSGGSPTSSGMSAADNCGRGRLASVGARGGRGVRRIRSHLMDVYGGTSKSSSR